jgi:hypothetical protein
MVFYLNLIDRNQTVIVTIYRYFYFSDYAEDGSLNYPALLRSLFLLIYPMPKLNYERLSSYF